MNLCVCRILKKPIGAVKLVERLYDLLLYLVEMPSPFVVDLDNWAVAHLLLRLSLRVRSNALVFVDVLSTLSLTRQSPNHEHVRHALRRLYRLSGSADSRQTRSCCFNDLLCPAHWHADVQLLLELWDHFRSHQADDGHHEPFSVTLSSSSLLLSNIEVCCAFQLFLLTLHCHITKLRLVSSSLLRLYLTLLISSAERSDCCCLCCADMPSNIATHRTRGLSHIGCGSFSMS